MNSNSNPKPKPEITKSWGYNSLKVIDDYQEPEPKPEVKKCWGYNSCKVIDDYQALQYFSVITERYGAKSKSQHEQDRIRGKINKYILSGNLAINVMAVEKSEMQKSELKKLFNEAMEFYQRAYSLAKRCNLRDLQCDTLIRVAKACKQVGRAGKAEEYFLSAYKIAPEYYAQNTYLFDLPSMVDKVTIRPT